MIPALICILVLLLAATAFECWRVKQENRQLRTTLSHAKIVLLDCKQVLTTHRLVKL